MQNRLFMWLHVVILLFYLYILFVGVLKQDLYSPGWTETYDPSVSAS
jgi:hypothetical protein